MPYCTNCGAQIAEDAPSCPSCGTPSESYLPPEAQTSLQQPDQQSAYQQQSIQQPAYQQQAYQQPYQQPGVYQAPVEDKSVILIVLSILELLFLGGLFAIIPLVFAVQHGSAAKAGDRPTAEAKFKASRTALIVVAAVGLLLYIFLFVLGGIALMNY